MDGVRTVRYDFLHALFGEAGGTSKNLVTTTTTTTTAAAAIGLSPSGSSPTLAQTKIKIIQNYKTTK
jgi:hypothetical protein